MNTLIISGILLAFLGIVGFAIPVFTTQQTKDVARVGDLQIQTQEDTSHVIPPLVSGGALILGIVLVSGGLYRRR
ncbi:hypothetical protein [Telmatospirillum siberiense]|uniref:DUF3185 domain-containing protein n=1 Tax=Telmatospirillum siberiense TaxID=382514 RepID=A0A2N3PRQ1_9PROT|nr:hypothetical protein [Telmatospirillum siberiense]PKU23080.1 hypothetical protein CWS72_18420 [Telmatospirillum siberiense]